MAVHRPWLRRDAAGDGERDGERQRDDPDDDAGGDVAPELRAVVSPQRRDQFRNEHA